MIAEIQEADLDVRTCVAEAYCAGRIAQLAWGRLPVKERLGVIGRARKLIAQNSRRLAEASTAHRRRPIHECYSAEVIPLLEACRFLEKESGRVLAPRRYHSTGALRWVGHAYSEVHREPYGVVLIIGPGNYPLLLPGVQLLQALAAGNAVVVKPGIGGTEALQTLREFLISSGLKPGLLTILPECTESARAAIEAGPDKVLFTGSAAVGRAIQHQLSSPLIPCTLELSGCDAVIVCADANLDLVTEAVCFGLEFNAGATCMAPKRLFVEQSIATELEGRLAQTALAPWRLAHERLSDSVQNAISGGAHFVRGGIAAPGGLNLPIILGGVPSDAELLRGDFFAPVLSLVTFTDVPEAILRANDCPYALGASVFSQDEEQAKEVARKLNTGVVTINDLIVPTADPRLPFGGRNRSGFGVTRGAEGLLELTRPKVMTLSRGRRRRAFDPPSPDQAGLFESYIRMVHGGDPVGWFAAARILWRILIKPPPCK